jgi:hypothetical protein
MENTSNPGSFKVDKNGATYWAPSGHVAPVNASSGPTESSDGLHQVEVYTGTLERKDIIPTKPVPAMSYGCRVRIARLYKDYSEFIGKEIRVGGWAKSTRAQSKDLCFVELNDGSCFKNL